MYFLSKTNKNQRNYKGEFVVLIAVIVGIIGFFFRLVSIVPKVSKKL